MIIYEIISLVNDIISTSKKSNEIKKHLYACASTTKINEQDKSTEYSDYFFDQYLTFPNSGHMLIFDLSCEALYKYC